MTLPSVAQVATNLRASLGIIAILSAVGAHAIVTEREITREQVVLDSLTVTVQKISTLQRKNTALICALEPAPWRQEHRFQSPCEQVLAPVAVP